ncbi:COG3650 family protein [Novosphingobium sp.]|uniref:COG3650 family protein n=1 Tax=Novosphingobium sp. TaxID=1874826 RepID=UPI0038BBC55D
MTRRLCALLLVAGLAACSKQSTPPIDATAPDAAASADVQARVPAPPKAPASPGPARPPASLDLPDRLRALGTEPFWSADVAGTTLTYGTPDFPSGISITVARRDGADFAEWSGTLDGKPLTLRVEKGPCSDGMSDRIYPYRVTRTIGPEIEQGCARPR